MEAGNTSRTNRHQVIDLFLMISFLIFSNALASSIEVAYAEETFKRIAVLPFSNHISPKNIRFDHLPDMNMDPAYDFFELALANFLTTDLWKYQEIQLVERIKIEPLIKEIKLTNTGLFDRSTAQEAGKATAAKHILYGNVSRKDQGLTISGRIFDLSTRQEKDFFVHSPSMSGKRLYERLDKALVSIFIRHANELRRPTIPHGETIAILPFSNIGPHSLPNKIESTFSEMLSADLSNNPAVRLVERDRIEAIFSELKLMQTSLIDESTALKIGRLLGANSVLLGTLYREAGWIRADIRLTKVTSGEIVYCSKATGLPSELSSIILNLSKNISVAVSETRNRGNE